ncbi:hypothetical protein [Sporosarcina newyorkensis]|nr:hypothetical protein [Sporosarcina newyorkensis]
MLESNPNKKHGMTNTRIYKIFRKMHERCYDPNYPEYHLYGGRGVKIAEAWYKNFESFYEWATANGYKEDLSIDRIETDGDYTPSNCRWADKYQQANNKRNNIVLEHDGKKLTLNEWARELGLPTSTVRSRYYKGKTVEEILNPVKLRN